MIREIDLPNFEYSYKRGSSILDVVLQGGDVGIDKPFIRKVIEELQKGPNSVLAFNFLYYERGEEKSSGPELVEELATLNQMLEVAGAKDFNHIRIVGKSLGAIVGSFFLDQTTSEEAQRYSIVVLGYVTGSVRLHNFPGNITIIQGEMDRFGGIEAVKKDLLGAASQNISYYEVKGADHSYRIPETKEPVYEDEAVSILTKLIG